jgi:hypothetical protein
MGSASESLYTRCDDECRNVYLHMQCAGDGVNCRGTVCLPLGQTAKGKELKLAAVAASTAEQKQKHRGGV